MSNPVTRNEKMLNAIAKSGVTVSPINPYPKTSQPMYRIVADEGKVLTNGIVETNCVDIETDDLFNWQEKDAPIQ